MKRLSTAILIVLLSSVSLAARGHRYLYRGGHYYPPRVGSFGYHAYRGGYRYAYGYSPSFTLGVYRPAAYANVGRCDWPPPRASRAYGATGSYPVVLSLPVSSEVVRANFSDLVFNVTPATAMVYVNGSLIGSARSFATERDRFPILEGEHSLRIEMPGYESFEATLDVVPNRTLRIDVQLQPLAPEASEK